ncbi:MAG: GHMP kinase, partial [Lentimicrobium sp.]|nr:GHMP kinase [Lentimicrobium sp.]
GGSGYDVACAEATGPILYKRLHGESQIFPVEFNPPFLEGMSLVYLGAKQHSDIEVEKFQRRSELNFQDQIRRITEISRQIVKEQSQEIFIDLLKEHEVIMGKVLDKKPVKDRLFQDFKGIVKSLGAWGGDFVLAVTTSGDDYLEDYFRRKSFVTILPYNEVILKKDKYKTDSF